MALLAFGVNHHTAPVEIRERVAFAPDALPAALKDLRSLAAVDEAAILSTCNRTELYCDLRRDDDGAALAWFSDWHGLERQRILAYCYRHAGRDAVRHALRVAGGLDSLVLGEPQILGQMKEAFAIAAAAGSVGKNLSRLFQTAFRTAKQVRTDTAIGASPVSVAFAAVLLAKRIFGALEGRTALVIGAGETIELAARHLRQNRIGRILVANRTVERARRLAETFGGFAIGLAEIPRHLAEADVVVSSTASPLPVLGKGMVESALRQRRRRPMLLVDIAVPRDIEPQVEALQDIYLYTVDDLHGVIEESRHSRREAAGQAEEIIDIQVDRFMAWLRGQDAVATIRALRARADRTRDETTRKALRLLTTGDDPARVVDLLARQLVNKLLHAPCVQMREAEADERAQLLAAARTLFRLDVE